MQAEVSQDEFITVEEAARLAGRSHWAVRRWLEPGGKLTRYKSLNRTVVSRAELTELVKPRDAPGGSLTEKQASLGAYLLFFPKILSLTPSEAHGALLTHDAPVVQGISLQDVEAAVLFARKCERSATRLSKQRQSNSPFHAKAER